MVIDDGGPGKVVSSTCYCKPQVCIIWQTDIDLRLTVTFTTDDLSICNRSDARLVDSSRNRAF